MSTATFEPPPRNANEQLQRAARDLAASNAAGIKAMTEACAGEFTPPMDLRAAANIIASLRVQRDKAVASAKDADNRFVEFQKIVIADVQAAINETLNREGSQVMPAANAIRRDREELLLAKIAHDLFVEGVRATMADHAMHEIRGLSGYFSGATPMLRAAEAAAIVTHHEHDRMAQEGYLRSRGWRAIANGWQTPPSHKLQGATTISAAVASQVKIDSEPFKQQAVKMREVRPVDPTLTRPAPEEVEL